MARSRAMTAAVLVFALALLPACSARTEPQPAPARENKAPAPPPAPLPDATTLQLPPEEIVEIEIRLADTQTVRLERADRAWWMVEPRKVRANQSAVELMVAVVAEVEIARRVSGAAGDEHGLGERSAIGVRARAATGDVSRFVVGAQASDETYVQLPDDPAVYGARGRFRRFFDLSRDRLRDPTITAFDVDDVERVVFENEYGELALVPDASARGGFAERRPSLRNFDSARASKNVAVLAGLTARGFIDELEGEAPDRAATGLFDTSTARATIWLRGQRTPLVVWIGARAPGRRLHVRTSTSDQVFLVSAHLESSLIPRPEHFERTDEQMQELASLAKAQAAALRDKRHDEGAPAHDHGAPLPTEVPPAMMRELRELADQQRR